MQYLSQTSIICWTQTKPQTQHRARDPGNQSMWQTARHLFRRVFPLWNHLPRGRWSQRLGQDIINIICGLCQALALFKKKKNSPFWFFSKCGNMVFWTWYCCIIIVVFYTFCNNFTICWLINVLWHYYGTVMVTDDNKKCYWYVIVMKFIHFKNAMLIQCYHV